VPKFKKTNCLLAALPTPIKCFLSVISYGSKRYIKTYQGIFVSGGMYGRRRGGPEYSALCIFSWWVRRSFNMNISTLYNVLHKLTRGSAIIIFFIFYLFFWKIASVLE
jgi:hypothetical protein